jgi:hypothetical protein
MIKEIRGNSKVDSGRSNQAEQDLASATRTDPLFHEIKPLLTTRDRQEHLFDQDFRPQYDQFAIFSSAATRLQEKIYAQHPVHFTYTYRRMVKCAGPWLPRLLICERYTPSQVQWINSLETRRAKLLRGESERLYVFIGGMLDEAR